MFNPDDILYEDNHLLIVDKHCGELVQPDPSGESALEDRIKTFIKKRDAKPGEVFLGVVHRIDRPVSGAVLFAKTSKALVRLNEMIREGRIEKRYWALTEQTPEPEEGELTHYILRDGRTNRSRAYNAPRPEAKIAKLRYRTLGVSTHYTLVEVELLTGRHHQIRAQLENRLSDTRRPQIRSETFVAERRYLAPFAHDRIRPSGAARTNRSNGTGTGRRQSVGAFRFGIHDS